MFDEKMLDKLWSDLKNRYGGEKDWDRILKDAHLGVARSDAGVGFGDIDPRVIHIIEEHRG